MRNLPLILLLLLCFTSCKSSKINTKDARDLVEKRSRTKTDNIIATAKSFEGTKYKYGGTTAKGMDCSGLIYVSFKNEDVHLPRISRDMATKGKPIQLNEVQKGDLLFFKTKAKGGSINHVGLVVNATKNNIEFIHATTSKGVVTSSLSETYWKRAFRRAKRIL